MQPRDGGLMKEENLLENVCRWSVKEVYECEVLREGESIGESKLVCGEKATERRIEGNCW